MKADAEAPPLLWVVSENERFADAVADAARPTGARIQRWSLTALRAALARGASGPGGLAAQPELPGAPAAVVVSTEDADAEPELFSAVRGRPGTLVVAVNAADLTPGELELLLGSTLAAYGGGVED